MEESAFLQPFLTVTYKGLAPERGAYVPRYGESDENVLLTHNKPVTCWVISALQNGNSRCERDRG